jgi:phospholipase/carboxylesterase
MKITHYKAAGLNCVEIAPDSAKPDLPLVIGLHGWGDWGENYTLFAPLLNVTGYRYVFPTGPVRVLGTLFSWFNLEYKGLFLSNLAPAVASARPLIFNLIKELKQRYNLPAERIALGGFSLGGMVTLDVGLHYPERLAGLFSLSGFLAADSDFNLANPTDLEGYYRRDRGELKKLLAQTAERQVPVLVAHGLFDYMIPTQAGRCYYEQLRAAGVPAELYQFWGSHQITMEELFRLSTFLTKIFK